MKKKIIALVLTLLSALAVFAACGKGKTLESVEVTAQPDKSLYTNRRSLCPDGSEAYGDLYGQIHKGHRGDGGNVFGG